MIKQKAIGLLNDTFSNDFEINRFSKFIKELLNEFTLNLQDKTAFIAKKYEDYISSLEKLGDWKDQKGNEIEVLVVKLKKTSSRDRARTMQRDFVASLLEENKKEAALVAFYGDDPKDWRFSYVKMEYNLVKDDSGKVKPMKELTPAKRYSFLVGVNEPNHTCASQFVRLITEDKVMPSLEEIEQAFSIEKVTKEFFEKYKDLFLRLTESLERLIKKDSKAKKELEDGDISTVDFTKKLLGQIVFLYFLQKKGWLGVGKGEDGKFKPWGTGPKDFMNRLFKGEIRKYTNFFNDILEPLFYSSLAIDRTGEDDYDSHFKCKIPFLNGGLFEPINDYNWKETDILIDNDIFRDIFKTFDEFNFTVKEDEPLEKEVAVDPEMLGKVFENLLEIKDRKSKGAFYTPREIVHYMCQQSLINYLETNLSIDRKDIENFIINGDNYLALTLLYESKNINTTSEWTLPKSIKNNYKEIDRLLKEIKIVDPAVGSGAFPVGMMNEIVKARSILSIYFKEDRKDYDLKRETIENCLYGVDIESSAVEITKLRFWLSLIVDELDMKNIKPLPNLDHKIMCGNSLLEEFEGVKLFDERLLGEVKKDPYEEINNINKEINELYNSIGDKSKEIKLLENKKKRLQKDMKKDRETQQITLGDSLANRIKESKKKLSELTKLQKQFFNEQNKKIKKQLRENIDRIEWELIEETLKEQGIEETLKEQGNEESIKKLEKIKKSKSKPFFLWKLYFAEIFQRDNPGFDVVIGNPPYISAVKHAKINNKEREYLRKLYPEIIGSFDLYSVFLLKGLELVNKTGAYSWIIPNRFLVSDYAKKIVTKLKESGLYSSIDVSKYNVFHDIGVYPIIILGNLNERGYKHYEISNLEDLNKDNLREFKEIFKFKTFRDFGIKIGSGTTGFQAKQIKPLIKNKDESINGSIPFAVSGSIDPYIINLRKVRYMNTTYNNPYISYDSNLLAKCKWDFWYNEKIVIAGMTKRIEATYIKTPLAIGVGCYAIFEYNGFDPHFLLAILNSSFFTYFLNIKFKDKHLAGGYLAINKSTIEQLPLKEVSSEKQKKFIKLAEKILTITKKKDYLDDKEKQVEVKNLEKNIDQLVYDLYELKPGEIKLIERFIKNN